MYYQQRMPPQEESIYNLIPPEKHVVQKPPRHVSKYPHDTPPTASTFGPSSESQVLTTNMAGQYQPAPRNHTHIKSGANFGRKDDHYADPTTFLTKQNKPPLSQPKRFQYTDVRLGKPAVPSMADTLPTIQQPTQSKNYIQMNALAAITQAPGNIPQNPQRFVNKKTYGKVPKYLDSVKKEITAEKEYISAAMAQEQQNYEQGQARTRLLPDVERLRLLDNLKKKWESVNNQYQGMTHCVVLDTIGKVRRKEEYEGLLKQLEQSIEKLSKQHVFVRDEQQYYY